mmetsp:Transcript_7555/g.5445  ORF Transcript_7555/g.5445 Transcript_7555/m.5445 type:complete len:121 (-) Transcript_7555:1238-1600(-)|eukprot:CAMPEP_0116872514 /NCGR_PEP_ID=MMETSP0463-20121206/3285_1 /TAXON_ID=181622 /ORGANISM="Strombidinopsis sp, Strain SopsisLIS2011" /LENGTH=120 /DNA_ID=CAMNT_0004512853 /DNA_START=8179 /DNA_END=8541 /DNA_ORIENTATION=+
MSDQFLERLSNLMMKQFTEKEQQLKLLLQKYMDEGLSEQNAIKANFKIDYDKLNELKPEVGEKKYEELLKKLKLDEANMIRDVQLKFEKNHKDEETILRKKMEDDHAKEQVKFRKDSASQ